MLKLAFISLVLVAASPAFAQDEPFAPFTPRMTPAEAKAAAPSLDWEEHVFKGALVGVEAPKAVTFLGAEWDLRVGDIFAVSGSTYTYEFDLKRSFVYRKESECLEQAHAIIAALEPVYGAFGQHRDFSKPFSDLYGPAFNEKFKLANTGAKSRLRIMESSEILQDYISFAETDEGKGESVFVKTTRFPDQDPQLRRCDLRINLFGDPSRIKRASPRN